MHSLPGYRLGASVYSSTSCRVFRAYSEERAARVMVKVHRAEYPDPTELARFENDYRLGSGFDSEWVIRYLGLERYGNGLAVITEDFEGSSVEELLRAGRLDVTWALRIAIGAAIALEALHAGGVVHGDIKPANLVLNMQTGRLKVIDFGVASRLTRQNEPIAWMVMGTLAYASPEQTGRISRTMDYRSDLYSLGVTLYELLTGRLPFEGSTALEVMYGHIARSPRPPQEVNPSIPLVLSDIVLELMAKTAEERYQSAHGARVDLEECLRQLEQYGQCTPFPLATQDVSGRFHVPQRLYGRETELRELHASFSRVAAGGSELLLVSGYPGIGKSALIREIERPLVEHRGYFASGKFDQFRRDHPYLAFIQAFQELVQQVMTESEERVRGWCETLRSGLGSNGGLMCELIPELSGLLGPQPPPPALGGAEALARFKLVVQAFVRAFATAEQPLVLFLDDLQWADSASLELLEWLVSVPDIQHLLLIGAYRENEVGSSHPFLLMLERIQRNRPPLTHLRLGPLELPHIRALVAQALRWKAEEAEPLARLLLEKTHGNPFFVHQLLWALHERREISLDTTTGRFSVDLHRVEQWESTDNVVDLMVTRIQRLPEATQRVLELAACIGNLFELSTLCIVSRRSSPEVRETLSEALAEGLVRPVRPPASVASGSEGSYRFLHDRVQQAACASLTAEQRGEIHARIGELLLENTPPARRGERILEIVNHLNQGPEPAPGSPRREPLARLNLEAGLKARSCSAHGPALLYLQSGLRLLSERCWAEQYALALALHEETAEVLLAQARFTEMEGLIATVLQQARTVLDQARVYNIQIASRFAQNRMPEALSTLRNVARLLGVRWPRKAGPGQALLALLRARALLWGKSVEDLERLPVMSDPHALALMRVLYSVRSSVYLAEPELFPVLITEMLALSLRHGNGPGSASAYVMHGLLVAGVWGNYEQAHGFGQLAQRLVRRLDARVEAPNVEMVFNIFVRHWCEPLGETLEPMRNAHRTGLEVGELEAAAVSMSSFGYHLFFAGRELQGILDESTRYMGSLQAIGQQVFVSATKRLQQIVRNLLGQAEDPCVIRGPQFDEEEAIRSWEQTGNVTDMAGLHFHKMFLAFLFGQPERALVHLEEAERRRGSLMASPFLSPLSCIGALTRLSVAGRRETERRRLLRQARASLKQLGRWARSAPANNLHRWHMVRAELDRVQGRPEAAHHYDEAIQAARKHGYLQDEAIANELAAAYHSALGRERVALAYLTDAWHCYRRWGALAKVQQLERQWPELAVPVTRGSDSRESSSPRTRSQPVAPPVDLASVMSAAQALSSELSLEELLRRLMVLAMENAGAQRGCLVLVREGEMRIEAECDAPGGELQVLHSKPLEGSALLSLSVVNFAGRTGEPVVLEDASQAGPFTKDEYIRERRPKSVLCVPLRDQGRLRGLLYLENNLTLGAFTAERIELLRLLSSQAALCLQNALLYAKQEDYSRTLEHGVEERTRELQEKNEELGRAVKLLRDTQTQLVVQEKLASLGSLTSGIAHELKNPLNFINNFAQLSEELSDELSRSLKAQRPRMEPAVSEDVGELLGQVQRNLSKIREHGQRATQIINGMLMHSRTSSGERVPAQLNALLSESLHLAYSGARARGSGFELNIQTDYDPRVGEVEVVVPDISRVFINVVDNACYALQRKQNVLKAGFTPRLEVTTRNRGERVEIRLRDNGTGIPSAVLGKVFNPFFTTKPAGEGTGLGLSLSHDIVVGGHQGDMRVSSVEGEFTELLIELPKRAPRA